MNDMTEGTEKMDPQNPKTEAASTAETAGHVTPFDELSPQPGGDVTAADAALDVPMNVQVIVGKAEMTVREVMDIRRGALVELDRKASDLVDVAVNGKVLAKGEITLLDDGRIGVSLVEIVRGRT